MEIIILYFLIGLLTGPLILMIDYVFTSRVDSNLSALVGLGLNLLFWPIICGIIYLDLWYVYKHRI